MPTELSSALQHTQMHTHQQSPIRLGVFALTLLCLSDYPLLGDVGIITDKIISLRSPDRWNESNQSARHFNLTLKEGVRQTKIPTRFPPFTCVYSPSPPPKTSTDQVRSSGIMGICSCGPSHLFHLRASQKHSRHRDLSSSLLPHCQHTLTYTL